MMGGPVATVDTGIYGTSGGTSQQSMNPVDTLAKLMGIQHQANVNAQFQQEFKARAALGPLMQQSVDPETGEFDLSKLAVMGSANPDVAWKLPELMNQIIQRKNLQADTVIKEITASNDRLKAMGGVATSLVQQAMERSGGKIDMKTGKPATPGISMEDYSKGINNLMSLAGDGELIDAKTAAKHIADMAGISPQERFARVKQFMISQQDVDKGVSNIIGAITPVDVGGHKLMVHTSPALGTANVAPGSGGSVETSPTAGERNAMVEGTDANGRPIKVPRASMPMQGGAGTAIDNTGPGATGTGSLQAGLSPQDAATFKGLGEGFVKYHDELQAANQGVTGTIRTMGEMQKALKEFKSGGGQEVREKLASFAQGMGADTKLVDRIAGGNLGAIQEFQKLAVQYATNEMKTNMGSSQRFTNLDFGTFLKNNPTINTDPRAIDKMFNWIKNRSNPVQQEAHAMDLWKAGQRPESMKGRSLDAFPQWWADLARRSSEEGKGAK